MDFLKMTVHVVWTIAIGNENILQRLISESAPYIKLLSFKSESL